MTEHRCVGFDGFLAAYGYAVRPNVRLRDGRGDLDERHRHLLEVWTSDGLRNAFAFRDLDSIPSTRSRHPHTDDLFFGSA